MFDGEDYKAFMGDREGGGRGQRLLRTVGIDLNCREECFWVGVT